MSLYKLVQIQCDGRDCPEYVDLHMSVAAAKREATANGWQLGRGGEPDLCPHCKAPPPSEDGSE